MRTIYQPIALLGGWAYRATSNGTIVHLQERNAAKNSDFKTVATLSAPNWEKFAEDHDLYDAYNDNPAWIAKLISELRGDL